MLPRSLLLAAVTSFVLAGSASAQDSVSNTGFSLPGDAAGIYDASAQFDKFVIDLTPIVTGWGNVFGIAPVMKTRKSNSNFANDLISPQTMSSTMIRRTPYPYTDYALWYGKGKGVRATYNDAPDYYVSPTGNSTQFAMAWSAFGSNFVGASTNTINGAIINFSPKDPTRLYVATIGAAVNTLDDTELDRSQFGLGSIDADGNVYFRADDFNAFGPNPITGNNIFRVGIQSRTTSAINLIDGSGGSDSTATDWLVNGSASTYNVPNCIPQNVGPRPVYVGSNFDGNYAYEITAGTTTTTAAHRPCSSDHRGNVTFSRRILFPGSIGTCTMLGLDPSDSESDTLLAWGVDANGNVVGTPLCANSPDFVTDNDDAETVTVWRSQHHGSQVPYRGGSGQVACGVDQNGYILLAATMETTNEDVYSNANNAIVVCKVDPVTQTVADWTLAAWVDDTVLPNGAGKVIKDALGNTVGNLTPMWNASGLNGPSMSAPMIDSVGNIWFTAAIEQPNPFDPTDTAIMRAVYDPANFSYELEKVLEVGETVRGINSGVRYQIQFMSMVDSNSIGSAATVSGNILPRAFNGMPTANLSTSDSRTLGGLAFNASITYDTDGDGSFDNSVGFDERYTVTMFMGHYPTPKNPYLNHPVRPRP